MPPRSSGVTVSHAPLAAVVSTRNGETVVVTAKGEAFRYLGDNQWALMTRDEYWRFAEDFLS